MDSFYQDLPLYISYTAMGLLALLPIIIGSFDSVPHPHKPRETEVLSTEDAYWFPILGSVVLFGFYLLFSFLSKEMVNMVITVYFAILGTVAVYRLFTPVIRTFIHKAFGYVSKEFINETGTDGFSKVTASKGKGLKKQNSDKEKKLGYIERAFEPLEFKFLYNSKVVLHGWVDNIDVVTFSSAIVFTCYYVYSKHWIASNIFGESFSITAISLMQIDTFTTGMILLAGLFFYDIFWVFGTDVMVTVATKFDAPIKILFPRDIFAEKYTFALLGLGDIVVPGIFVALCLRFDHFNAGAPTNSNYTKPYFYSCLISYIFGLATTIIVMHTFKAAQPALLYLSPACILSVLITALTRGELKQLFLFSSSTDEMEKAKKSVSETTATSKLLTEDSSVESSSD